MTNYLHCCQQLIQSLVSGGDTLHRVSEDPPLVGDLVKMKIKVHLNKLFFTFLCGI